MFEIVTWPAKVLESRALEVTDFDVSLQELAANMHKIMDREGGVGLAANQINQLKRVLTIYIPHSDRKYGDEESEEKRWWHNQRFTLVNPVILQKKGRARYMEGCLSFPEIYDFVERANEVTVKAFDEFGKELNIEADGLFSVCLQHEIDHLDGIVFTERMSRLKANTIRKKMQSRR